MMMIDLDSKIGTELGFTSDFFKSSWLYLDEEKNVMWISCIISIYPGKGDFRRLVKRLINRGYNIIIPTPLGRMVDIGIKQGWKIKSIKTEHGDVECFVLENKFKGV